MTTHIGRLLAKLTASDLVVFPSLSDPWGLVVNEAMAAGKPVLCSTRAGCCDDLVIPGRTGFRTDPLDAERFPADLAAALSSPDLSRLGNAAREHVAHFTPGRMAEGLRRAVRSAAARRGVD